MPLVPGTRLGAYGIVALIGEGGMGQVYRARDTKLKREVAIKVLPETFSRDPERTARFRREAQVLAQLNHPHIAAIYGLEDTPSTTSTLREPQGRPEPSRGTTGSGQAGSGQAVLAIVMELVEGETLAGRLRAHPSGLRVREASTIASQIADALDAAHEKGIVHRDLKPANVKITRDGVVKVLDFGLAKVVSDEDATTMGGATEAGQVVGTVAYMSPEQARGQTVDKRTDIWAFGCVLYEMVTGRRAFAGRSTADILAAILGPDLDLSGLPGDIQPHMRRLIGRCLATDVKRRMRDIGDAREDLIDAPLVATSPGPSVVSRRGMLSAAALGLVGVGVAGGMAFVGRPSPALARAPTFRRLTFRRGLIRTARFAPDYQTVLYGALWDGDVCRIYVVRPESPESVPLSLPPAMPLAISSSGELALALGTHLRGGMPYGTLARAPLAGGAPRELLEGVKYADWSPDGRDLAVVRRVDGGREQLEFPVGSVLARPEAPGGGMSFPRVSPRGDAVAFFDLTGPATLRGTVTVVDRTGARRTVSRSYFNVFGLAWKGDEVWFTGADELPLFRNAVHALAPDGQVRLIARMPGNASLHDVSPDGRMLIARTDDRGGISVVSPGDGVERDLSWLDSTILGDISSDGRRILFSETGVGGGPRNSTYLRGTDGSAAVRLGDGQAVALSPDGKWAITRTIGSQHLDLIPTGAGQPRRLERPGLTMTDARWLPNGLRVVVRAQQAGRGARRYSLAVDGQDLEPITPDGITVGAGSWALSPDATLVAVTSTGAIGLYPVAGGPARQVPGISAQDQLLAWIEGGLLVSAPGAAIRVFRIDPVSGRRELWKEIRPGDPTGVMTLNPTSLVVTPDGRSYGYSWHRAISDLYLVEGWS